MRILVVEDEAALAAGLAQGLREHGYAVDLARDGEEALDFVAVGAYDLIVLDVMLPKLDGFAVCTRLRQQNVPTPVLMLTARDTVPDRVTGLDSGADDYLTKPFAYQEFLARVRALLRREGPSRDPVLRIADLEVYTRTREARRASHRIELTSKEYAILECLIRNPNQVLSRDQIAEHVWDFEFSAMSNVVDVHIYTLRCKVDRPFRRKLIETVRRAGYRLRVPPT